MTHGNQLVARLSPPDRRMLLALGTSVRLVPGLVLYERGEDAASIFFPTAGAVLLSVPAAQTPGLGVLLVGREGMLGVQQVLGSGVAPLRAVVLTGGDALRIDATSFGGAISGNARLNRAMLDYVGVLLNQVAAAAACARFHGISPRLAAWLLMVRDRECADSFHLTQDSLAGMLGVRREGVTVAAHEMHRLRLIDYRRGEVTLLDMPGLRTVARDCYPADLGARNTTYSSVRKLGAHPRRSDVTRSS